MEDTQVQATAAPETPAAQPEGATNGQEQIQGQTNENNNPTENQPTTVDEAFASAIQKNIDNSRNRQSSDDDSVQDDVQQEGGEHDKEQPSDTDSGQGTEGQQSNREQDNADGTTYQGYTEEQLRQETQQISNYIDNKASVEAVNKLGDLGKFIDTKTGTSTLKVFDLARQTEDGTTVFINPFNADEPFDNMTDAKQALENFNDYLQTIYSREKQQIVNAETERYKPSIRAKAFSNRFAKMGKLEQEMFMEQADAQNAIVRNNAGKIVGFTNDFDLEGTASRIEKFVERVRGTQGNVGVQGQQQEEATQPPVDTPASAVQQTTQEKDKPSETVEEAFVKAIKKQVSKERR